jgi:hypothetical protein
VLIFLLISAAVTASFAAMSYAKGITAHWWQIIIIIFAFSVIILLSFVWLLTCMAITKVARELADEMEKVRSYNFRRVYPKVSGLAAWSVN